MRTSLLTVMAVLLCNFSFGQFTFLLGRYSDPKPNPYSPVDTCAPWETLGQAPANLEAACRLSRYDRELDWQYYGQLRLASFLREPGMYGDYEDSDTMPLYVACGYSLMFAGNFGGQLCYDQSFRKSCLEYFALKDNRRALFNWVKKAAIATFKCMPAALRRVYRTGLKEVLAFINTYNYEKEFKFLKRCYRQEGERNSFYALTPNGQDDPTRKLKAFVFRRDVDYRAKNWTPSQINLFQKETGYRPAPKQGISITDMKEFVLMIKKTADRL